MLRLTDTEARMLTRQPETGMGYQIVEATTKDDKRTRGVVYNAELFFREDESRTILLTTPYADVLKRALQSPGEFRSLQVLSRSAAPLALTERKASDAKAKPAKEADVEKTKAGEVSKRYSAYANDNRRMADGSWSEGTYATTEEDARNVKTGRDAVERYALPNPDPACYVFTGRPAKDTDIQRGIVEPAFGRKGGGVEVIFPKGAQPNTVTGPTTIAKE